MAADKQKTEKERERERCVQRRLRGGGTKYRAARKVQLWADMQCRCGCGRGKMGDSSSSSAARPPRHRPPPADPARLHITRLCLLPGALKISQLVTTGRAAVPAYTPLHSSSRITLSTPLLGSHLRQPCRVCLPEWKRRTRTGGRTDGGGRGKDAVVVVFVRTVTCARQRSRAPHF